MSEVFPVSETVVVVGLRAPALVEVWSSLVVDVVVSLWGGLFGSVVCVSDNFGRSKHCLLSSKLTFVISVVLF